MYAEIITIGDELLLGQTTDTNSAFIGSHLAAIGLPVKRIQSVADEAEAITAAMQLAEDAAVVIITGGLGPTKDDITKQVLCEFFQTRLIRNNEALDRISTFFNERNLPMLDTNIRQADVPESCTILPNYEGTASGMWFEKRGTIYISIPGVPYEMKPMLLNEILPKLQSHFMLEPVHQRMVYTTGIGESFLAEKINEWENTMREKGMNLAYLPSPGIIRLRITSPPAVANQLDETVEELHQLIPQYIFGGGNDSLENVLGELLLKRNETVVTAESCTGGLIAHLLTSIAGSSRYFMGSVVSYSNEVKVNQLGVSESDLMEFGAVSKQVVEQMATGVRTKMNADYAMATSGIAGPDGGTEDKPVGMVWISVCDRNETISKKFLFGNNRERNIKKSTIAAMNMLRKFMLSKT